MLLGLETFSYLPWFMAGCMDVFGFVRCDRAVVDSVACVRELSRAVNLR